MQKPEEEEKGHDCAAGRPEPPWPKYSAVITFIPWPFIVGLAGYILLHTSRAMLGLWLAAFILFFFPLRYLVCACCPYYGQRCSSIMGMLVPLMFEHRPGGPLTIGLWLDVVAFAVLAIIPLPHAWRLGGFWLTALWVLVFGFFLAAMGLFGCRYCPFTHCPIGRASRGLAGMLGLRRFAAPAKKDNRLM